MIRNSQNLIVSTLATFALLGTTNVLAATDDASFNRVGHSYAASSEHKWVNALLPQASGDFVAQTEQVSADEKFMRQIAYYTRDMLDRGGWVNVYVSDIHYAVGNALLTASVGDGVTSVVPA